MSGSTACRRSRPTIASRAFAWPGTTFATRGRRSAQSRRPASAWSMRAACRSTGSPPTTAASFPRRAMPSWRRGSSLPERAALVALSDGRLAGFAVMRACRSTSRIGPLFADSPAIAGVAGFGACRQDRRDRRGHRRAGRQQAGRDAGRRLRPETRRSRRRACTPAPIPRSTFSGMYGVTSFELG